jgi:streptogrisin C
MHKFVSDVCAFLLLLILSGSITAAQEPNGATPNKALLEDAGSYAERYRVSLDEAVRRLRLQSEVGELGAALAGEEQASFAGLWIEHEPTFRVVLSATDRAALLRSLPELDSMMDEVEVRSARWTLADLENQHAAARAVANRMGLVVDSDINVRENRVELYVVGDQEISRLRGAEGGLPPSVVVIGVDRLAQPNQLKLDGGEPLTSCTGGFTVTAPNGTVGISTAAHCENAQRALGLAINFRGEDQEGNQDVQWHAACGLIDVSGDFNSGIGIRKVSGTRHRDSQPIGTFVCKFGMTTGRTCGTIKSRHYAPSYVTNAASTFIRVAEGNVRLSDHGDSGGPWYIENLAYGIHSGFPGDDDTDALYMPINYISVTGSIGVTVLRHDPPGPECHICSVTLCGGNRPPCCNGVCRPVLGGLKACRE